MKITFELMPMAQVPRSTIAPELLVIMQQRAWYTPTETVLFDHLISNEFFIMIEELEDVANDPNQTDHVRALALEMYDALPDVTYVHIIDQ